MDSFSQPDLLSAVSGCEHLKIADAELWYYAAAFSEQESREYFDSLLANTPWRQDQIQIHGKSMPLPRLQTWYSDNGDALSYSGMRVQPLPLSSTLSAIKQRVLQLSGHPFNGVLVTCYRDGNDSVGWHSDNEKQFGPDPIIASVSFGARRDFQLKHLSKVKLGRLDLTLTPGSLLVMGHGVQTHWSHQLPKRKRVVDARINLTFRNIV